MSMLLIPRNHQSHGSESSHCKDLEYNLTGWRWMRDFCQRNGVDTSHFRALNDGDFIPEAVCKMVADVIDAHRNEYNQTYAGPGYGPDPATEHAKLWRESGGVEQW